MTAAPPAALSLRQVRKSYGAVEALKGVDLEVPAGRVMAICGDNGAGKSTLIRIISGAQAPTGGELSLDGKPVVFGSPHDALAQGIATIYQDLALAPRLSIWENVFMGAELVRRIGPLRVLDKRRMAQEARGYLQRLSVPIDDMDRPVEAHRRARRQGNRAGPEPGAQAARGRAHRHPDQPQHGGRGRLGRPRRDSEKRHQGR